MPWLTSPETCFSVFVESLNLRLARKATPVQLKESISR